MRTNLEDNRLHSPQTWGGRWQSVRIVMTSDLNIDARGPNVYFLDPNGSNRIVALPSIEYGRYFIIGNVSTLNDIEVRTSLGAALITLAPGESAWFISSDVEWMVFGAPLPVAANIAITPAGNIASTNVQSAIYELDGEKASTADLATVAASVATKADKTITLTAGAGLTGGGDLSANRTFDVGAGTGIAVNANDVALAAIAAGLIMANLTAGAAAPSGNSLSAVLDNGVSSTRGAIAARFTATWSALLPGTAGHFLKSNGAGADLSYAQALIPVNNLSDVSTPATAFNNIKQTATTAATGVVEIAVASEVVPGASSNSLVPSVKALADAAIYGTVPQNSQSANYTTDFGDANKHILHPSTDANARTFTIAANASVPYDIGTTIMFVNRTTQVVTIAITADTLRLAGTSSTGSRSLALNGVATALKIGTTEWIISGPGLS